MVKPRGSLLITLPAVGNPMARRFRISSPAGILFLFSSLGKIFCVVRKNRLDFLCGEQETVSMLTRKKKPPGSVFFFFLK